MKAEAHFEKRYRLLREIIETIVLTVLMFVIINLAIQNFDVDGMSMENSLHDKERIMVDKVSYLFHAPSRGDVIVFIAPPHPQENYVKRIIGLPGDVLTIKGSTVIVDGVTLKENYLDPKRTGSIYHDIVDMHVPTNEYFVMGDNRVNSSDSRDWGFLPRSNIIGRAALVYWPLGQDNNGFLPNVSNVFARVQQKSVTTPAIQHTLAVTTATGSSGLDQMLILGSPALVLICTWYWKRRPRAPGR